MTRFQESDPLQAKGVLPPKDIVRPEPIRLVNWADVIRGIWSSENANRLASMIPQSLHSLTFLFILMPWLDN